MTNTSNTLHLSCFYLFSRTIDSVTFVSLLCMAISISSLYKCTRSPLNTFKCSSILESFWPSSFHTRKGSYVSLTCGLGHKLRHQTFDPWTGRWILSSVEVLSHCSPESKAVLKISQASFNILCFPDHLLLVDIDIVEVVCHHVDQVGEVVLVHALAQVLHHQPVREGQPGGEKHQKKICFPISLIYGSLIW